MATCREIVRTALRKLGVVNALENPEDVEGLDGLASLQSLYDEWFTSGAFGALRAVTTAVDATARPSQSILVTADGVVITPPSVIPTNQPDDCGCRWDYGFIHCDPRLLDMAVYAVTIQSTGEVQRWIYSAQNMAWKRLNGLTLSDWAPLSDRGQDGLAALLATRIADEYGQNNLSALTARAAGLFQTSVMTRFGQTTPISYGEYM